MKKFAIVMMICLIFILGCKVLPVKEGVTETRTVLIVEKHSLLEDFPSFPTNYATDATGVIYTVNGSCYDKLLLMKKYEVKVVVYKEGKPMIDLILKEVAEWNIVSYLTGRFCIREVKGLVVIL